MPAAVSVEGGRLRLGPVRLDIDAVGRLAVVGGGKAGRSMAEALHAALGPEVAAPGRLVGHVNVLDEDAGAVAGIELHGSRPAGSPLPTPRGQAGAEAMLRLVAGAGPADVVVCLLSGGASAMIPAPVRGVSLDAKRQITRRMGESGATIEELNAVRKHLSRVKGGRLASAGRAGALVSLVISDVVGDRLDVIASGPTAPDPTTYGDAIRALRRRWPSGEALPAEVVRHLLAGERGEAPETPKQFPDSVANVVVGGNATALAAAEKRARELGYSVLSLGSEIRGEARDVGADLADLALAIRSGAGPVRPPACVLAGGETTVSRVATGGKGGRNQELVLAALDRLAGEGAGGILVWSAGTDGEDGPTDVAGAFADAGVLGAARALDLDPRDHLGRSRSYDFFARVGGHVRTGPTGTNVMDVCVVLVR